MQNEALLGTYLLPQATMRTATLIAMHITSDKIHSLQVGCKSFEADYITGPEVDVAPKLRLRTDIFHSAQPLLAGPLRSRMYCQYLWVQGREK